MDLIFREKKKTHFHPFSKAVVATVVHSIQLDSMHSRSREQVSRNFAFDVLHREKMLIRFSESTLQDWSLVFHNGSSSSMFKGYT